MVAAPKDVKSFLILHFNELLGNEMEEAILCHLNPFTQTVRFGLLLDKLKSIVEA